VKFDTTTVGSIAIDLKRFGGSPRWTIPPLIREAVTTRSVLCGHVERALHSKHFFAQSIQ
jgi:hypothetical protein